MKLEWCDNAGFLMSLNSGSIMSALSPSDLVTHFQDRTARGMVVARTHKILILWSRVPFSNTTPLYTMDFFGTIQDVSISCKVVNES